MFIKILTSKVLFIFITVFSCIAGGFAGNINDELDEPGFTSAKIIKAPTELGLAFAGNYYWRKDKRDNGESGTSFYLGPGFYFDYRFSKDITFSLQNFVFTDKNDVFEKSRTYSTGLFVKHWISPGWGYIGAGLESMLLKGENNGKDISETDIMLSIIITGENVHISRSINSTGDLKAGISIWNGNERREMKFSIQYSLGIGFQLSNK